MKFYYFSIFDLLRARTNQIADVRLCEGFTEAGCDVEMITPYVYRPDNIAHERIFQVYDVAKPFKLTILPTPFVDNMRAAFVVPVMLIMVLLIYLRIWICSRGNQANVVVMSRTPDLLIPAILLKRIVGRCHAPLLVCWAHEVVFRRRYKWVYRNCDAIVGTNSAITEDLRDILGIDEARMAISLNPISESQLGKPISKAEARARLGLPSDARLVVYTGKLGLGLKEPEYILEAARLLPKYSFLFTGGRAEVVESLKTLCASGGITNVSFVGFLHDYSEVRYYQAAADVLVSYYTAADHETRYNLPNKICEYMLSGRPIVTSEFPATRDVLTNRNAFFVRADDPVSLADGIQRIMEDSGLAEALSAHACGDVAGMTFAKTALRLRQFFQETSARLR